MSKSESYIKITPEGTVHYCYVEQHEKSMNEALLKHLGGTYVKSINSAFSLEGNPVGLIINQEEVICFMRIRELHLNTRYKLWADGHLRPHYALDANESFPKFTAKWIVPDNMKLIYSAALANKIDHWKADNNHRCHLMAFKEKVAYRLPLPNLYDNGDICMGMFNGIGKTVAEAFTQSYDQFKKSEWNADLLDNSRQIGSDVMFKFDALEKTIESVIHPDGFEWWKSCPKLSTTISTMIGNAI